MCRSILFRNQTGRYCFKPSWRAREAEIVTLALRAYDKKMQARRLEVLHDTSLCKRAPIHQASGAADHTSDDGGATPQTPSDLHEHTSPSYDGGVPSNDAGATDHTLDPINPVGVAELTASEKGLLQIEVLRMFRQGMRFLRAQNPSCDFVCFERPVDTILRLVGIPPLWHEEQLISPNGKLSSKSSSCSISHSASTARTWLWRSWLGTSGYPIWSERFI